MLFPRIYCTDDESICQITIGEGEINAAASMTALVLSPHFDLRQTYFLIAGIAGVNPRHATTGSVAIAQWAVQVGLQYEMDSRDMPAEFETGYIPYGREYPLEYPTISYGSEVFQLNSRLRDMAYDMAAGALMDDTPEAAAYRALYSNHGPGFTKGTDGPAVERCDVATSDVWFSGMRLADAFEKTAGIWTNGSATYCMTAQEDNASLEALLRGDLDERVDFQRVIIIRAGECLQFWGGLG